MFEFYISGVDFGDFVDPDSLRISRRATTKNTLSLTLYVKKQVQCGEEIVIKQNNKIVFGGLIQSIDIVAYGMNRKYLWELTIQASGYSQITSRRTVTTSFKKIYAGNIFKHYINNVLMQEGLTEGVVEQSAFVEDYSYTVGDVRSIFDKLCEATGYMWYVDDNKKVHFVKNQPMYECPYVLDTLDDGSRPNLLVDFWDVKSSQDISNYRNKQFVVGKSDDEDNPLDVAGSDQDDKEIERMSKLYGSGVYGNVIRNDKIYTVKDAQMVADFTLAAYGGIPQLLDFCCHIDYDIDVLQFIYVRCPELFIDEWTAFFVHGMDIKARGKFLYKQVYLTKIKEDVNFDADGNPKLPDNATSPRKDDWVDSFGKLKRGLDNINNNNSSLISSAYFKNNDTLNLKDGLVISLKGYNPKKTDAIVVNLNVLGDIISPCSTDVTIELYQSGVLFNKAYTYNFSTSNINIQHPYWGVAEGDVSIKVSIKSDNSFLVYSSQINCWITHIKSKTVEDTKPSDGIGSKIITIKDSIKISE